MTKTIKLPIIPLRGVTAFPRTSISFPVGREKSINALSLASSMDKKIFIVLQKNDSVKDPEKEDLYEIGVIATIKNVMKLTERNSHVVAECNEKARLIEMKDDDGSYNYAEVEIVEDDDLSIDDYTESRAYMLTAREKYEEYLKNTPKIMTGENNSRVLFSKTAGEMSDAIMAVMNIDCRIKQTVLEMTNPLERIKTVVDLLAKEGYVVKLKREIDEKVKTKVDETQKDYILREQLKTIQGELGDKDGVGYEVSEFYKKLEEKNPPQYVKDIVVKELKKFEKTPSISPESNVMRNYIELILQLPWNEKTEEKNSLKQAEKILKKDHYGLEEVKERIIEFLAVRKNTPKTNSTIICLQGPPGVGKTSIAKSIAKALNRTYIRMSLGGIKDEAEIRGHRRTYIGAMPGRIINAMNQAKVINPLILLDEIDKLCQSYNGDPAAALLEVLDPEQNFSFRDHYLDMPYDLSNVLFICTANSLDTIPEALRDRMEIITLSSYTSFEKKNIASKYLLPKQLEKNGLKKGQLVIKDDVLDTLIDGYTREAGVRQLERIIGKLCGKAVKEVVMSNCKKLVITNSNLEKYLGTKKIKPDKIYSEPQVGIVRGLAWTSVGGVTLSVEVNSMKGTGKLELTGKLGDVMKESAKAALTYIRSNAKELGVPETFYKTKDIHVHIPEGAVPKDGPSAGITLATAIISELTGKKVKNDVGMTGEITIRGRVLPIGGLKEKVIAAKKAGVKTVIFPLENKGDFDEIPDYVKEGLKFILVEDMKEVLKEVFVDE